LFGDSEIKAKDIECCRANVFRIIEQYKPNVIVLFGNDALLSVVGNIWKRELGDLVKCLMHVYKEAPLSIRTAKRGATEGTTMYLMADERKPVIQTGWMEQAGKIVIIGQKIAEMFAREMDGEIITIPGFRFEKNFVVLAVGLNDEERSGGRRGEEKRRRRKERCWR